MLKVTSHKLNRSRIYIQTKARKKSRNSTYSLVFLSPWRFEAGGLKAVIKNKPGKIMHQAMPTCASPSYGGKIWKLPEAPGSKKCRSIHPFFIHSFIFFFSSNQSLYNFSQFVLYFPVTYFCRTYFKIFSPHIFFLFVLLYSRHKI